MAGRFCDFSIFFSNAVRRRATRSSDMDPRFRLHARRGVHRRSDCCAPGGVGLRRSTSCSPGAQARGLLQEAARAEPDKDLQGRSNPFKLTRHSPGVSPLTPDDLGPSPTDASENLGIR